MRSAKKGQATKNVSVLKQELDEFESERSELDSMKAELDELKASLEKEKKVSKDLNLQNVRLNSLVKIGHESLKMEEDRVRQLQSQLNLNNGSLSAPVNGSNDTNANNCLNPNSDNTQESEPITTTTTSTTNPIQTQTPLLSNITNNKSKRKAASAKKWILRTLLENNSSHH